MHRSGRRPTLTSAEAASAAPARAAPSALLYRQGRWPGPCLPAPRLRFGTPMGHNISTSSSKGRRWSGSTSHLAAVAVGPAATTLEGQRSQGPAHETTIPHCCFACTEYCSSFLRRGRDWICHGACTCTYLVSLHSVSDDGESPHDSMGGFKSDANV